MWSQRVTKIKPVSLHPKRIVENGITDKPVDNDLVAKQEIITC